MKAKEAGVSLFIIGMGTPEGAPLPLRDGSGFKKDDKGNLVLSRLNESALQQMALATGGSYVRSVTGDEDLEQIYLKGIKQVLEASELKSETKNVGKERFQFPLILALLLLMSEPLISEVASLTLILFLFFFIFAGGREVSAFSLFGFDQANMEFDQGNYSIAEKQYRELLQRKPNDAEIHFNLGNTLYREQKFSEAEDHFKQALNSQHTDLREKALYNLGNTFYRGNKLEEAVDAYNKALEIKPDDKNAHVCRAPLALV